MIIKNKQSLSVKLKIQIKMTFFFYPLWQVLLALPFVHFDIRCDAIKATVPSQLAPSFECCICVKEKQRKSHFQCVSTRWSHLLWKMSVFRKFTAPQGHHGSVSESTDWLVWWCGAKESIWWQAEGIIPFFFFLQRYIIFFHAWLQDKIQTLLICLPKNKKKCI